MDWVPIPTAVSKTKLYVKALKCKAGTTLTAARLPQETGQHVQNAFSSEADNVRKATPDSGPSGIHLITSD